MLECSPFYLCTQNTTHFKWLALFHYTGFLHTALPISACPFLNADFDPLLLGQAGLQTRQRTKKTALKQKLTSWFLIAPFMGSCTSNGYKCGTLQRVPLS